MKRRNYGLYAIALAVIVVGALWAGLPAGSLALLAVIVACPLMMFFMMRGMHGDQGGHGDHGGSGSEHEAHQRDAADTGSHDHSWPR